MGAGGEGRSSERTESLSWTARDVLGALTLVKEIACGSRRIDGCCIEIGNWLASLLLGPQSRGD